MLQRIISLSSYVVGVSMLTMLAMLASATAQADVRKVLVISSYHATFNTYRPMMDGLKTVLASPGMVDTVALDVEFMDSKRRVTNAHKAAFRARLADKISNVFTPDLVIVADDNAFRFALEEQDLLLQRIPIVFLGVGDLALAAAQDANPQVTGVVERPSIQETMDVAAQLIGPGGQVHLITDATTTGRLYEDQLVKKIDGNSNASHFNLISLDDLTYGELAQQLRDAGPSDLIILIAAYRDRAGTAKSIQEIVTFLQENASVPFLHPWMSTMGHGSLGGKLVSHYEQGLAAGDMALRIFDGASPSNIPVIKESPNRYIFDYVVMEKFGIDASKLPAGSEIQNAPRSLLQEHMEWVAGFLIFLTFQTAIIVGLTVAIVRRRVAEKALAESESKLRDILYVSTDWFWECNQDFRLTFVSDRYEQRTGIAISDKIGTGFFDWGPKNLSEREEEVITTLRATMEQQVAFRELEIPTLTSTQETRYVRVSGTPRFEAGVFKGYRGTGTDITLEVDSRNRLAIAMSDLQAASQAKSAFLANISHELRTPLNAINGMSEAIACQVFGPVRNNQYVEYAQHINNSGKHLQKLMDDVLDLARIEARTQTLVDQTVDLETMLRSCRIMLSNQLSTQLVKLEFSGQDCVQHVTADETRLRQILLNLIGNAVKFSPSGEVVFVRVTLSDMGELFIMVEDRGCGIGDSDLDRVLMPYEQVADPKTSHLGGVGLGLPLAKMLTELHGGSLRLESQLGKGTTAIITWPRDRVVAKVMPADNAFYQPQSVRS